jgi:hypothetical protein
MALRLYRGQTLLGSIEVDWRKADFPWHGGAFTPTEHFESVRRLFEAELALRGRLGEWDQAYAQIVQPGLRLEDSESGKVHDQVLIHILQRQEARFRIIIQPSSRWMKIVSGRSASGGLPRGAWSPGSFDNDDARDWLWGDLEEAEGTAPIAKAFAAVLEADNYLEAPKASIGIAAAEVVAALLGKPAAKLPDEVASWVGGKRPPESALVKTAQRIVKRILRESELKDLWAESSDPAKWQQEVEGLLGRLEDKSGPESN